MTAQTETSRHKHAVILCHPEAESFNAAVAQRYCEVVEKLGDAVILRDLYRLGFDPVLKSDEQPRNGLFTPRQDVADELQALDGVDVFVLVYPIWFGTPPAMLKGYVERIFGAGFSFRSVRAHKPSALMTGKRLVSFSSSGTNIPWLEEQGAWVSLRNIFDRYLKRAFSMQSTEHVHLDGVVPGLKQRFVNEHLYRVEQTAKRICGELRGETRAAALDTSTLAAPDIARE